VWMQTTSKASERYLQIQADEFREAFTIINRKSNQKVLHLTTGAPKTQSRLLRIASVLDFSGGRKRIRASDFHRVSVLKFTNKIKNCRSTSRILKNPVLQVTHLT
jgi:hypothetical protein